MQCYILTLPFSVTFVYHFDPGLGLPPPPPVLVLNSLFRNPLSPKNTNLQSILFQGSVLSSYGETEPEFPAFGETPDPWGGRRQQQERARQIQTQRFLGARAHHTFQKAVKERTPDAANAILSLCQQQRGPQCLARAVCFRPEKALVSQGRPNTPPVSPRGAYFCGCVDTARCRNAASSRHMSRW